MQRTLDGGRTEDHPSATPIGSADLEGLGVEDATDPHTAAIMLRVCGVVERFEKVEIAMFELLRFLRDHAPGLERLASEEPKV